jgi:hypothetical protein
MAEIHAWRAVRIRQAYGERSATGGAQGRRHRAGARLWALLHAPALLRAAADDPRGATFVEDDYRRLAGRRAR